MKKIALGLAMTASALTGAHAFSPSGSSTSPVARACTAKALPAGARCGSVRVSENRDKPGGRKLDIHYAIIPGMGSGARDPIFFIAGGPGQSAIETAQIIIPEIRSVDKERDIVLIDQRGTGRSNAQNCANGFDLLTRGSEREVARCVATLSRSADLRRYLTSDAVDDLEAVRAALGYDRINIAAASYGVRPALAYMRLYPSKVRSALLRAASAPDFNIIAGGLGNADIELERVVRGCEADAACHASYPQLRQQLREVENRLRTSPEKIAAPGEDIVVTPELLQQLLYATMLSAPLRQQIPFIVSTAAITGFAPMAPLIAAIRDALYGALPVGMYLSILCSEDAPRLSATALRQSGRGLGSMIPRLHQACKAWPKRHVPTEFFAPFRSQVPTLILSGEHDPATTFADADRLRAMLPNSRHVLLSGEAHGPLFPACVQAAAGEFLNKASTSGLTPDCSTSRLPPFRLGTR
jgi:pimeloyl-ACP methyl ester carboxylesterase